jgi:hypothetical protein
MRRICSAKLGPNFKKRCRCPARFRTAGNRVGGDLCGTHANQYRRIGWLIEPIAAEGKSGG